MTFSFTAPLIGTDADVKSAKLNALFTEIETELADLGGISDLKFPDASAASQYMAMLLNAGKTGFDYSHVLRMATAVGLTGAPAAGKAPVASSSSAGTWDFVPTLDGAFDITGTPSNGQVLQATGANTGTFVTLPESPYSAQASNFTAASGGNYIIGSSVTQITLPNSPAVGNVFSIFPGNGTNLSGVSVIQAASGEYIGGANATYVCPNDKTSYSFICVNTGATGDGWIVVASPFGRQVGIDNKICDFRLTLASATPITTSDQTAKTTVYASVYQGNRVALYNSTTAEWEIYPSPELSVAVPSTTNTPFDLTMAPNISTGAVTFATVNWTNDTTRATAVTYQDGVPMIGSARLIGTGRTTGSSGQTEVTSSSCLLTNIYNIKRRSLLAQAGGGSTSAGAWTTYAANTTLGQGRVQFIQPLAENGIIANHIAVATATGGGASDSAVGIGLDSTSAVSGNSIYVTTESTTSYRALVATYQGIPSAGYHYVQRLMYATGGGGSTFRPNSDPHLAGMYVEIMA